MAHIFSSSSSSVIMSKERLFFSYLPLLLLLLPLCCIGNCRAKNTSLCITSSCGNINISYPFTLRGDPANCGHQDPIFALECHENQLKLHTKSRKYHVEAITYSNFSIRLSDPGLDSKNYTSCPIYSYIDDDIYSRYVYRLYSNTIYITYINCLSPVANASYVENPICGNITAFSNTSRIYSYVTTESIMVPDLEESCTFDTTAQTSSLLPSTDHNYSYAQIHDMLAYGFELSWYPALCTKCDESKGTCSLEGNKIQCRHYCYEDTPLEERDFFCKLDYYAPYLFFAALAVGALIALRFIIGLSCLIGLVVNQRKRQRSSINNTEDMEEILSHQLNHMPINYTYREMKKMAGNFKAKVGGGPHGTVYRGNLRSGPLVAVKMLNNSSADDKELIRRASAISWITNGNIVKFFGFCMQGKKRGLVHEFVQGGSLEERVSLQKGKKCGLSCGEMFKITVGIARGIQCLHAANILHLGIKPRNILLDEGMNPKISDPGLERLESSQHHRTEADKGKMGFIPPEMLYKNVGEISCKADVYSFGMVVMEMAAQLQSLNPYASKAGKVYFPLWIYNRLREGKGLERRDADKEEEEEMIKKMIIAGLWCIQIRAGDRPMIGEVIGMLEGKTELLHVPPIPFQRAMYSEESF